MLTSHEPLRGFTESSRWASSVGRGRLHNRRRRIRMELSRRDVLKLGVVGSAALLLPLERYARTEVASRNRLATSALPARFTQAMPVQTPLAPTATAIDGKHTLAFYDMAMRQQAVPILGNGSDGRPLTNIWGDGSCSLPSTTDMRVTSRHPGSTRTTTIRTARRHLRDQRSTDLRRQQRVAGDGRRGAGERQAVARARGRATQVPLPHPRRLGLAVLQARADRARGPSSCR